MAATTSLLTLGAQLISMIGRERSGTSSWRASPRIGPPRDICDLELTPLSRSVSCEIVKICASCVRHLYCPQDASAEVKFPHLRRTNPDPDVTAQPFSVSDDFRAVVFYAPISHDRVYTIRETDFIVQRGEVLLIKCCVPHKDNDCARADGSASMLRQSPWIDASAWKDVEGASGESARRADWRS